MAFRKAIIWSVGGQLISYFVLFVGSVFVARLLSPREMGVFAIAMATTGILNVLVSFNIGSYIVREKGLRPETMDTAFTLNSLLATVICGIIVCCSFLERYAFHALDVSRVLLPLALSPLIAIFEFRGISM